MSHGNDYKGMPYQDEVYAGGPQPIPGVLMCAYYDFGGEGMAYHDTITLNQGSGQLNPVDGSYLHSFRINESVDTSYTKSNGIDDSEFNFVQPEMGMPYVGWTEPGEWMNYTVDIQQAGSYRVGLLYTSNRGGSIALYLDGVDVTGPLTVPSTFVAEDPEGYRQWHHWNRVENLTVLSLPEGIHVLALLTVSEGQMNYGQLTFTPA